jgi:hypothetical protein
MHDLLSLALFSAKTLSFVLANDLLREFILLRWRVLVVALTLPGLSTQMKRDLREIGFWILHIAQCIDFTPGRPGVPASHSRSRPSKQKQPGLCTHRQVRDALKTCVSLIVLMSNLRQPISVNQLVIDPLKHSFRKLRR